MNTVVAGMVLCSVLYCAELDPAHKSSPDEVTTPVPESKVEKRPVVRAWESEDYARAKEECREIADRRHMVFGDERSAFIEQCWEDKIPGLED